MERRKIKDYRYYEIDEKGNVYSLDRYVRGRYSNLSLARGRKLKPNNIKGYNTVAFRKNSNTKRFSIHRLVYETFVGEIKTGLQINHKDGDKLNNHYSNLETLTPKENTRHAWENGLCKKRLGTKTSIAKLNDNKVRKIRELGKSGLSQTKIALLFNVHQTTIFNIINNKTWTHVK